MSHISSFRYIDKQAKIVINYFSCMNENVTALLLLVLLQLVSIFVNAICKF